MAKHHNAPGFIRGRFVLCLDNGGFEEYLVLGGIYKVERNCYGDDEIKLEGVIGQWRKHRFEVLTGDDVPHVPARLQKSFQRRAVAKSFA